MFNLFKKEFIEDINSTGYVYTHHSGAKLIYIENDDENRVFSIAFRTMPRDNCGTAHIVEHCVLCGSKNYNIKDPFNILDKGSLHTYLNAMTYQDKTIYPIGSTNEKDFKAMLRVYCDAVFNPLMYENEGIFRQEGWNSDGKELSGVVLNEMKGVYSDSSVVLDEAINRRVYSGTAYEYDAGGDPKYIPRLTYEEFLDFHRENYHPSNAIIYLYGKLNISEYMDILDNEFIGKYNYRENKFIAPKLKNESHNIKIYGETTGKNTLQAHYKTGDVRDFSKCLLIEILCDLLFNTEGAYIKEEIKDLGSQVSASFSDSAYFTDFQVEITGSDEVDTDNFRNRLNNAFKNVVIDDYKLQGVVNSYKFFFKEEDFGYKPKGLFYNTLLLRAFLYDDISFEPIKINKLFDNIKNYNIRDIIDEYFVDKGSFGIMIDSPNKEELITVPKANNSCVAEYQAQKDSDDEIAKINISKVADISKEAFKLDYVTNEKGIFIPIKSDVTYIDISFDTSGIDEEYLAPLGVVTRILSAYNIKYSDDIDYYLGGFSLGTRVLKTKEGYKPYVAFNIKTLNENINKARDIFKNVITQDLNDIDRLKELLEEEKQILKNKYISSGQLRAYTGALSQISPMYNYVERVLAINYYEYISNTPIEKIAEDINFVLKNIVNSYNMEYSVCGNDFVYILPEIENKAHKSHYLDCGKKQSIGISSDVNFNGAAFKIDCRHGSFKALQQMITREYLWDKLRLEGGAYGGGCRFSDGRYCYMYSYRDPQLKRTYDIFKSVGEYASVMKSQSEIDRFILGAINEIDAPVKNNSLNALAIRRKVLNIDNELVKRRREELLSATAKDIALLGEKLIEASKNMGVCTVGRKEDIEKNMDILGEFYNLWVVDKL